MKLSGNVLVCGDQGRGNHRLYRVHHRFRQNDNRLRPSVRSSATDNKASQQQAAPRQLRRRRSYTVVSIREDRVIRVYSYFTAHSLLANCANAYISSIQRFQNFQRIWEGYRYSRSAKSGSWRIPSRSARNSRR